MAQHADLSPGRRAQAHHRRTSVRLTRGHDAAGKGGPLVATAPKVEAEPKPQAQPEDTTTTADAPHVDTDADVDPDEQKTPRAGATHMLSDNGVEDTSEVSGMTNSLKNLASNRSRLKGVTRNDK